MRHTPLLIFEHDVIILTQKEAMGVRTPPHHLQWLRPLVLD